MANVAHASLTGSQLHEPKGADSAATGTVYVSNGAGSGSWQSIGTSSFTGMIADFPAPLAPAGWLECDGSIISTSTYAALFGVLSFQSSGTRTNGNAVITSIPSTANMKVGYYVFGTGINTGVTILSIDSATQITLSAQAISSGSSAFAVSPFLMNTGTIKLPDFTTAGRYRRSRTSSTIVGSLQADQNQAHTHSLSVTGTTDSQGAHQHSVFLKDPGHNHNPLSGENVVIFGNTSGAGVGGGGAFGVGGQTGILTTPTKTTGMTIGSVNGVANDNLTASAGAHTHSVTSTGTSGSTGSAEARPLTMIVLTCIKT